MKLSNFCGFFSMLAHPSSDIVGETNPRAKAAKCFQGFVTGFYSFYYYYLPKKGCHQVKVLVIISSTTKSKSM